MFAQHELELEGEHTLKHMKGEILLGSTSITVYGELSREWLLCVCHPRVHTKDSPIPGLVLFSVVVQFGY